MIVHDVEAKPAWDVVDLTVDLVRFVTEGRVIQSVVWAVPEGDGIAAQELARNGTVAGLRVGGGSPGTTYEFDCRPSFADGTRETVRLRMKVVP